MNITKIETNYKRNLFWKETEIKPSKYSNKIENKVINIYPDILYNDIIGFGAALTESACVTLNQSNEEVQRKILEEYFSENNFTYNLCRLQIGSSDFSQKSYDYAVKKDLSDFSIEKEKKDIIPIIKKILKINPKIKFLASPWSPPKFMKTNNMRILGGKLKKEYYLLWAEYLAKFILAYKEEKINIDFITIQNEPNATQVWESCIYSADEEIDFAVNYLYKVFNRYNISTKILIWDHNKEKLLTRVLEEIKDNKALNVIDGFAFHWYTGDHFENIRILKELFPNKLLIHTEGCTGYSNYRKEDEVNNAEIYAHDILGDLNSGVNGYIDWNLVLNHKGRSKS